jgi:hypothetical protein
MGNAQTAPSYSRRRRRPETCPDRNGNLKQHQRPLELTIYYWWDSRGLLKAMKSVESPEAVDNAYRYTGLGTQVYSRETVPESHCDWDGVNVVRERNMDGTVSERRVPGHAAVAGVGQIAQVEKASGGSAAQYVPAFD